MEKKFAIDRYEVYVLRGDLVRASPVRENTLLQLVPPFRLLFLAGQTIKITRAEVLLSSISSSTVASAVLLLEAG